MFDYIGTWDTQLKKVVEPPHKRILFYQWLIHTCRQTFFRNIIPGSLCVGIDANRNFGFHWGEGGSSDESCEDTYRGPEPWSAVEVARVRDYILDLNSGGGVWYYQDLHSASQKIVYPWGHGCTLEGNDDAADQDAVARKVEITSGPAKSDPPNGGSKKAEKIGNF